MAEDLTGPGSSSIEFGDDGGKRDRLRGLQSVLITHRLRKNYVMVLEVLKSLHLELEAWLKDDEQEKILKQFIIISGMLNDKKNVGKENRVVPEMVILETYLRRAMKQHFGEV